jgi:uncharacterized protein YbaR (Trm112 family)
MARAADSVDRRALEMLVCPLTKTRLILNASGDELISIAAYLAFPIRKGVPMLSLDEAREVTFEEMDQVRHHAAVVSEP